MRKIGPGLPAPDFTLSRHDGGHFTLSDALKQRPVILVFYPLDGSPGCGRMLSRIQNDPQLRDEYQIVAINHSATEIHEQFARLKDLNIPLLTDQTFKVAEAYDSLYAIGPIKVIRYSVVGIGQDGIIRLYQKGRPDNDQIFAGMKNGLAA